MHMYRAWLKRFVEDGNRDMYGTTSILTMVCNFVSPLHGHRFSHLEPLYTCGSPGCQPLLPLFTILNWKYCKSLLFRNTTTREIWTRISCLAFLQDLAIRYSSLFSLFFAVISYRYIDIMQIVLQFKNYRRSQNILNWNKEQLHGN